MAYPTKCEAATAIAVALISSVVLFTLANGGQLSWKVLAATWESLFKIAAIIGAGVFFAFKACGGYNNLNLSVLPTCERRNRNESEDFLAVHIALDKGTAAAFSLEGIEVQITSGSAKRPLHRLPVRRLRIDEKGVAWNQDVTVAGTLEP